MRDNYPCYEVAVLAEFPDIPWSELDQSPIDATGDFLVDAANAARRGVCRAYRSAASAIINSPLDNPAARLADATLRRICEPVSEIPDNAPIPVGGGQCECVEYDVTVKGTAADGTVILDDAVFRRKGKISPIDLEYFPGTTSVGYFFTHSNAACDATEKTFVISGDAPSLQGATIAIVGIERVDGQPDVCGDMPPTYPARLPAIPDLKFPVTLPVGGRPTQVDVEIVGTKFEVGVQIKPTWNVNVGGIQVNLDITGAKITIAPTLKLPDILPPSKDPRPVTPTPVLPPKDRDISLDEVLDKLTRLQVDMDEVLAKLRQLLECACDDGPGPTYEPDILGSGDSGVWSLPDKTVAVLVVVSSQPVNPRRQEGNLAPDVLYAGWGWFGKGTSFGDRNPIDCADKLFVAPVDVPIDKFGYTMYEGFSGLAVALVKVEPD